MSAPSPSPSAVIRVLSTTPISECIELMTRNGVGAVVVCAPLPAGGEGDPIGIFTERDLLRNARLIQVGGYWDFAVINVSSRPLLGIDESETFRAAELMLSNGFRHLPVFRGPERALVGMLSMRDVLRACAAEPKAHPPRPVAGVPRYVLEVLSQDPPLAASLLRIMRKLLRDAQLDPAETVTDGERLPRFTLIDADDLDAPTLAKEVGDRLTQPQNRGIWVLHSRRALSAASLGALQALRSSGRLELLPKPLNVLALADQLDRHRD